MNAYERKYVPYFNLKSEGEGRVRKGIAAVFGNVDSGGDRIINGAFAKTINEGIGRVRHLWNHDYQGFSTAKIISLKELNRDELPDSVLDKAPEASGGLMVEREYYADETGNKILARIDAGDINEMSFGYDVIQQSDVEEGEMKVRNLLELRLFDISDVNWGMNSATVASGVKRAMPLGALVLELNTLVDDIKNEIKAGRRNANNDETLINAIHIASYELGCTNCLGVKIEEPDEVATDDEAKAAADASSITALFNQRTALQKLQIELLR